MFKGLYFALGLVSAAVSQAQLLPMPVTSDRLALMEELEQVVASDYVLEDKIAPILLSLKQLKTDPAFIHAASDDALAELLTETLKPFDRHFTVRPYSQAVGDEASSEGYFDAMGRRHSGIRLAEIMQGNVGYLAMDGFDQLNHRSRKRLATAMSMLEETHALIIDLRKNGGGSPDMVSQLASYLFKERVHLTTVYDRTAGSAIEFWTERTVEGKKRPDIPVYILTSEDTFSAAEQFAYDLQSRERATIVGEVTGGGAHPIRRVILADAFVAHIPFAKAISPVTKSNWEWIGVKPDVQTSRQCALDKAYQSALQVIRSSATSWALQDVETALQSLAGKECVRKAN